MRYAALGFFVFFASQVFADEQTDPKTEAIHIATLALVAPTMCPELETNQQAVTDLLARAHLSRTELTGRYRRQAAAIEDDFKQGVSLRPGFVCSDVWERLGVDGLGLLMAKGDD